MKIIFTFLFLFLLSCVNSPNEGLTEGEQTNFLMPIVSFDPNKTELFLYNKNSQNNFLEVSLGFSQDYTLDLTLSSRNKTSEIFRIVSSQINSVPQNCVKKMVANEECSFSILIPSSVNGVVVVRIPTSSGLKMFYVKIKRSKPSSNIYSLDKNIHIGGYLSPKNITRKVVVVKNEGEGLLNLEAEVTGRDPVISLLSNSCKDVNPNRKCFITYLIKAPNMADGVYESEITLSSGSEVKKLPIKDIQVSRSQNSTNKTPEIQTEDFKISAGETKRMKILATDQDNDSLTYFLENTTNNLVSNFNSQTGDFDLQVMEGQDFYLEVVVSDGKSPSVRKQILVKVFPSLIINKKVFIEGEIQSPLFSISLDSPLEILKIKTDLSRNFSIINVLGTGSSFGTTGKGLEEDGSIPLVSGVKKISLNFVGAAKVANNDFINFEVDFSNGDSYVYKKDIEITGKNLPYVKYDIVIGSYSGQTVSEKAQVKNRLFDYIKETHRTYENWRTPLLVRITEMDINCQGSVISQYDGSSAHENCLKNLVSVDAETVFVFKRTYSGATEIGGIAQGLRAGAVISALAGRQTVLTHELGHNFGLWHTHETAFNSVLGHCGAEGCFSRGVYANTASSSANLSGDFSNYIIDMNSSLGYIAYNYGSIVDDTGTDFYGARKVSYNPCFAGFCLPTNGFKTNEQVFLSYGQDSQSVCQQSYSSSPYYMPVLCSFNESGFTNGYLDVNIVYNVMSYWDKPSSTSLYSFGQKRRMDNQLQRFEVLTTP